MNIDELKSVAAAIVAKQKGVLAADESNPTIKKRFDAIQLESTEENHRRYRELLFTAEGIERLWEISVPLLESPPPVRSYAPGSWGPNSIHQLIAPHAWRLPFERAWRAPTTG